MAIRNFSLPEKQIFESNILLIICCIFYLVWWLLAFKPVGAIRGIKTGWLLIPAFVAGIISVILAVKGIQFAPVSKTLFPSGALLLGGVAAYIILLVATQLLFHRQVTTELFLIVGWAVLALSEINALYGINRFSQGSAILIVAIIGVAALISLICYVLYYGLNSRAGYFDGMVPLVMVALVMGGISLAMSVA